MRVALKLALLLVLTVVACLASTTAAATAQVEVFRETADSTPCNPCAVHFTGESHIVALPSGIEVSTCQDDLEGTINHNGTGELTWTGSSHGGVGCNVVNCTAEGEDHWPLTSLVEASGPARITMRLCYRVSSGAEVHCDVTVTLTITGTHEYQPIADDLCVSDTRRVEGLWASETGSHDTIELAHGGSLPVEVLREGTGRLGCDPCSIHLTGESHITAQPSGVLVSQCEDELEGTINQNGTGELTWTGTQHAGPGCNVANCTATGEDHWPLTSLVEVEGPARITLRPCYRATGDVEVHCDLTITIGETGPHEYQFTTSDLCVSDTRRVEGTWQTEADTHEAIELVHSDA